MFVARRLAGDALARLEEAGHAVTVWPGNLPPHPTELRDAVADTEGLLTTLTERVDQALLDAAPQLKVIANYAIGFDNIDLDATTARDIAVGVTPDVLTDATADLAFALLLAAARRLPEAAAAVTRRALAHLRDAGLARRRRRRPDDRDRRRRRPDRQRGRAARRAGST